MASLVSSSSPCSSSSSSLPFSASNLRRHSPFSAAVSRRLRFPLLATSSASASPSPPSLFSETSENQTLTHSPTTFSVVQAFAEDQLWAAACLRVRSFYAFDPSVFRLQDHKKHLAEREFEALKDRVSGKREEFRRVSCINATVPLSQISNISEDLCTQCKFSHDGEERVVVATLDLNQGSRLPDEIVGSRPMGVGADYARAYLSNVCVASELHRKGLGHAIVAESKLVAQHWGITDLYVHVVVDNEPAKKLYLKSGFVRESDEPAWHARFLDRPRRILLWTGLPCKYEP